jgi:hypothetical protein
MAEETEFAVVELDHLIWPASLQMPVERFHLFVAADTTHMTTGEISDFAEAALAKGMVYFCSWGAGCERFHDIVDDAIVIADLQEHGHSGTATAYHVMTTWHDDETLDEALDFLATCAIPADVYTADNSYRVVMCVGNPEWASVARRFLKAAKFLI